MLIDLAKYTCPGGHDINEDSYLCSGDKGIFIVADGLGGHVDGEKASAEAVRSFEENCCGNYNEDVINDLIEKANTDVTNNGGGGKSTVAAAFIENGFFRYANVGDSRVYYFRKGQVFAVTKDHSVCQASVDMGLLKPEDIRNSEDRPRLLKVLGSAERVNLKKSYSPIKIEDGDAFLICSDGFWEYVYESEAEADLLKSDTAEKWLGHMLKRHLLRSENKGDNYTAICGIFRFDEKAAAPSKTKKTVNVPPVVLILIAAALITAACVFVNSIRPRSQQMEIRIKPEQSYIGYSESASDTE
ncbi:MAG: PP2C family protein-serine/threonine phosphatase [Huintestinicola sp.]